MLPLAHMLTRSYATTKHSHFKYVHRGSEEGIKKEING